MANSDLITITLQRDKAEYMSKSFLNDLKWLGVTAGIDLGNCYIDFIEQVRSQSMSSSKDSPTDMKTFRLALKKVCKNICYGGLKGITVWSSRGKIAFRFRSQYGKADISCVGGQGMYWTDSKKVEQTWIKIQEILEEAIRLHNDLDQSEQHEKAIRYISENIKGWIWYPPRYITNCKHTIDSV